ncbi:epoxide hydrolase family protein [Actinomycetospora sp. NBRC 106378]|uniref:epoxide hydrolase family protein n=1 Tax=Actinomycetospora sp. NBRC 106378 TaxID=3032208 RepID=UPI00249FBA0A|nr:epoxide hydrolase family protein [Actinomycetospora sp. NBRC 106378]GLZ55393.1 microsomal epoxide hydrolase [Actinomycetospora sp. NBRC 106378]
MTATADAPTLTPFTVAVPEAELADLRRRLHATRWPDPQTVPDWSQGAPLPYVRDLAEYWAREYDWRATEARLAELPQYRVTLDGLGVHLVHLRSPHPGARPLLITHGWPGTFVEQLDVLADLVDPPDPADAFHVVCPSLPGFGFSERPAGPGWGVERIAAAWVELMGLLGYERFGLHGGDWGSYVSSTIALRYPDRVTGLHLTMPVAAKPETPVELDAADQAKLAAAYADWRSGSGYASIQSTRPQTLGYGLTDSPVGQLAWIAEKFWEWADHDDDLDAVVPRDRLLDTVSTHWFARTAASSARLYWESYQRVSTEPVAVPTGCSIFPGNAWMPRAWCERRFTDLRSWHELASGGHFPALEAPRVLAAELRAFFGGLR